MIIEFVHPLVGKVVKELRVNGRVRLSDLVETLLRELNVNVDRRGLEPYYLVVINGNQLDEGTPWERVLVENEDRVVLIPFASGG